MWDFLVTAGQLLGIGLMFGLAGPCALSCSPLVLSFAASEPAAWKRPGLRFLLFLGGRWSAYVILGAVAGGAAQSWQRLARGQGPVDARLASGVLCLVLAGILAYEERHRGDGCRAGRLGRPVGTLGAFLLGLSVSILPCGPLVLLLSEVALISQSVWQGMAYTGAFGAGAVSASLVLLVVVRGLAAGLLREPGASARFIHRSRGVAIAILAVYGLATVWLWFVGRAPAQ
jgi:sulfite exporter TauE/SafE